MNSVMKNLIDSKFGLLRVIKKAPNIIGKSREYGAWECLCDCGNIKIVATYHLNRGNVKSCGCLRETNPENDYKIGDYFNRLTLVKYYKGKWECLCDCGNNIFIKTGALTSGNTKSCGCLKTESSSARSNNLIESRRQFKPRIASARRVWKSYCYRDNNCNISFDEFMIISQRKCFYCGIEPNTSYNYFSVKSSRSSNKAKEEGIFIYNGLDRINSLFNHTSDNVVACCYICNRAKNNKTTEEFVTWINNLQIIDKKYQIVNKEFPKYYKTSVKVIWSTSYNDGNISLENFESLSQYSCHYCNGTPNNIFNYAKTDKKSSQKAINNANFIYNGLDRINPNLPHNLDNVVPCCKYCNFTKSNLSLEEFQDWIKRIQSFQNEKS